MKEKDSELLILVKEWKKKISEAVLRLALYENAFDDKKFDLDLSEVVAILDKVIDEMVDETV